MKQWKTCKNCGNTYSLETSICPICGIDLEICSEEDEPNESFDNSSDSDDVVDINDQDILILPSNYDSYNNFLSIERKKKIKKGIIISLLSIIVILLLLGCFTVIRNIAASNKEVKKVIDDINSIGTVEMTDECKAKIDSAFSSFYTLTEKQQAKIDNLDVLTAANDTYNDLVYYNKLIAASNFVHKKATAAMEILSDMKTVWNNTIYEKTDEYNKGNYDFDTAMEAYWDSLSYLSNSLLLFDDFDKDKNSKTISEYLVELKNPPEQYKSAYSEFTALYACYSAMVPLTDSINHTFNAFSSEVNTLSSNYKIQYGKTKAVIPEMD